MKDSLRPVKRGTQDRRAEFNGFTLTETVRQPGLVLPRHYHAYTNLGLALRGAFVETIGERSCEVSPGSLILRPAGEMHANRYGRIETRCLIIEIRPQRLEMIRQTSDILQRVAHLRSAAIRSLAQRLQGEFRLRDEASSLAIEAIILELLAQAMRQHSSHLPATESRSLRDARDFIHARFCHPLGLSEIAEAAGVHPSHLAKMFRRHYRCTVGAYVRRLRLEYAAQELSRSDKTLSEIALAAGFYDQSHFTHVFKLHFGLTPSAYRAATQTGKARTKRL